MTEYLQQIAPDALARLMSSSKVSGHRVEAYWSVSDVPLRSAPNISIHRIAKNCARLNGAASEHTACTAVCGGRTRG